MNRAAQKYRFLPLFALGLAVIVATAGLVWLMRSVLSGTPAPQKQLVQEVRIIRPPPPPETEPPPPPPPEEEVDVPEPESQPDPTPSDEPPPGEQLGLDAEGTAGGDGFGLVGRKGGRDLLASGGSAYAWYADLVKGEILSRLEDETVARRGSYSVVVRVWLSSDGTIERYRLAQSTGDPQRDRAIEQALGRVGRISRAPPPDLPQPVNLRIISRA